MTQFMQGIQEEVEGMAAGQNGTVVARAFELTGEVCDVCNFPENAGRFGHLLYRYTELKIKIHRAHRNCRSPLMGPSCTNHAGHDLREMPHDYYTKRMRTHSSAWASSHGTEAMENQAFRVREELHSIWPCSRCIERFNPTGRYAHAAKRLPGKRTLDGGIDTLDETIAKYSRIHTMADLGGMIRELYDSKTVKAINKIIKSRPAPLTKLSDRKAPMDSPCKDCSPIIGGCYGCRKWAAYLRRGIKVDKPAKITAMQGNMLNGGPPKLDSARCDPCDPTTCQVSCPVKVGMPLSADSPCHGCSHDASQCNECDERAAYLCDDLTKHIKYPYPCLKCESLHTASDGELIVGDRVGGTNAFLCEKCAYCAPYAKYMEDARAGGVGINNLKPMGGACFLKLNEAPPYPCTDCETLRIDVTGQYGPSTKMWNRCIHCAPYAKYSHATGISNHLKPMGGCPSTACKPCPRRAQCGATMHNLHGSRP
jgi:hypothetical protein